jgi:LPS export ABC transporter protein LptC/lipopolysaccharide transport protein LptA
MAMTIDARGRGMFGGQALLGAQSPAERARAFRTAGRHTRLVKVLRVAMPVFAVFIVALYALTLRTSWQLGAGQLDVGQVELTADDLTMKNPKYFGVSKDGGHYEVRAKRAILELSSQAPIKLIGIDGDLVQPNKVVTKLKSKHGLLDNAKGELELYDGIEIDASNGLQARMSRATVYSKEHRVVSKHPVDLVMPTGTVRGATMTMNTTTRESTFVGDVAVHLVPSATGGQASAGFGRDTRQPVDITSQQLYINDTDRIALFTGSVVALQGDTVLKTPDLRVAYEGKAADQLTGAKPESKAEAKSESKSEGSRLSRMVASKGVVITAGADRRVSSDQADFDAKADTALFVGNVLVNQQKNVLQGRRLFVDRKSSKSRLDSPGEGNQGPGRIAATLFQGDGKAVAQPAKPKSAAAELAASVQGGMLGTFKMDSNAPMDIEANTLDIFDATKQAVFRTNVKAQQGDLVIRTVELTAHYTGQSAFGGMGGGGAEDAAKGTSQLTRVDAKEKVLITSKDGQTATGDWATFDVKANTVLLIGHVVVSRGKDVAEGPRLKIDLTTGMYRFEVENDGAGPSAAQRLEQQQAAKPPGAAGGPAVSSSRAETPTGRTCPPGKQCLLVFPQEAKDRAKGLMKKTLPNAAVEDAWQPSTSGSSVIRND